MPRDAYMLHPGRAKACMFVWEKSEEPGGDGNRDLDGDGNS